MSTGEWYAQFARTEARGVSPIYERLAVAVSADGPLLELLDTLAPRQRQPNTLFAAVRLLGGPVDDPTAFHDFVVERWTEVEAQLRTRTTQTNEPGRCALMLPVLAALLQPLALLEVGASAGLLLYPDRYRYRYGDEIVGATGPVLECDLTGVQPPTTLPEVVWRAGLELNPLDVTDPDDMGWLEALVWPEHKHRRQRLREAAAVARSDPPLLVRGDLVDDLPDLVSQAPRDATLVVFHSAVLYQVPQDRRMRFVELVQSVDGHWVSIEAPHVLPFDDLPPPPGDEAFNVLALDGRAVAWTRAHGQSMQWFDERQSAQRGARRGEEGRG